MLIILQQTKTITYQFQNQQLHTIINLHKLAMKGVSKVSPTHQSIQLRRRSQKIKIDVNYISEEVQGKENHHRLLNDLLRGGKQQKRSSQKIPLHSSKKNIKIGKSSAASKEPSLERRLHSRDKDSESKQSKNKEWKKISEEPWEASVKGLAMKLKALSSKFSQKSMKDLLKQRGQELKLFDQFRHKIKFNQSICALLKCVQDYLNEIWKKIAQFADTSSVDTLKFSKKKEKEREKAITWKDLDVTTLLSSTAYFGEQKCKPPADGNESKSKNQKVVTDKPAEDQLQLQSPSIDLSEESQCPYIADPSIQVSVKWLRSDLKQKLQLNLSNLDSIRKREMPM